MLKDNFLVKYSKKVDKKFEDFVNFMWDTCRYRDTGLYDEDLIVDNFIQDCKSLIREIKTEIEEKIKSGVFWVVISEIKEFEETKLVIFVRSYNITCFCKKWHNYSIITIEDILIKT